MRQSHHNNFDFLRFWAATLVLFSHCYPLSGRKDLIAKILTYETGGELAVFIFFIISGYLITASYMASKNTEAYLAKRVLRIFPAYIVALFFCALVIGPLVTTLPLSKYLTHFGFWKFLASITLVYQRLSLPGVFTGLPSPMMLASAWTIPIEFALYLLIAGLGKMRLLKPHLIALLTISLCILHFCLFQKTNHSKEFFVCYWGRNAALFFAGSALFLYRQKLVFTWPAFFLALGILIAATCRPEAYPLFFLVLPYVVICFALLPLPGIMRWGKYGDFSYGIYLYAFPVQQCVMLTFGTGLSIPLFFSIAFAITLLFAVISWYVIEAPALRLKKRINNW